MNTKLKVKLIKELSDLAPKSPSISTKKSRSTLLNELLQLMPEKPSHKLSGRDETKTN